MELDTVDWASLETAYGPATELPELLRALREPGRAVAALDKLSNRINHQGWASPAAVPCVAWLIETLDHPGAPVAGIVALLADLSFGGNHDSWLDTALEMAGPTDLQTPFVAELDRWIRLLDHDEPEVRAAAGLAVAAVPGERSLGAVRQRIGGERKAGVKASWALALGVLGDTGDVALLDAVKRPSKAVQIALAAARVWLLRGQARDEDLQLLLDPPKTKRMRDLPWSGGDLGRLAEVVVNGACTSWLSPERLTAVIQGAPPAVASKLVSAGLRRLFDGVRCTTPDELTPGQRALLELLAGQSQPINPYLRDVLREADLTSTRRGLRIWMGAESPGALDLRVDDQPVWRHLAEAIRERDPARAAPLGQAIGAESARAASLEVIRDKHHFPDLSPGLSRPQSAHLDGPPIEPGPVRVAEAVAELLRPQGEAARQLAEEQLAGLLDHKHPWAPAAVAWLLTLSRLGPLDARFDPIVARRTASPPASRSVYALREILRAMPEERREAILLPLPLVGYRSGNAWAVDPWWYLPACPTRAIVDRVVEHAAIWAALPPGNHTPFPVQRAAELVEECEPHLAAHAREGLAAQGVQV